MSRVADAEFAADFVDDLEDREREREEQHFPADEDGQIFPARPRDLVPADAAGGDVVEVIHEMPLDREQPVEEPKINSLQAVKPISFLLRREPAEEADVDVI